MTENKHIICPYCKAEVTAGAKDGEYICEYCLSHFKAEDEASAEENSSAEADLRNDEENKAAEEAFGEPPKEVRNENDFAAIYRCPNCRASLKYDVESHDFFCEYCLSHFTEDQVEKAEVDRQDSFSVSGEEGSVGVVYKCPTCGAEIITDETTAATKCFYCHSPVVLSGRLAGEYSPDMVIPFKIKKEAALKTFQDIVKKKKFLPKNFGSKDEIENFKGVYFPYWCGEYELDTAMKASATKIRIWRTGDTEYTETKQYDIRRSGNMHYKNYLKDALKKSDNKLTEGILPYSMRDAIPFNMSYLSGFMAEKRDVPVEEAKDAGDTDMVEYSKQRLMATVRGYNSVYGQDYDIKIKDSHFKYMLLPVWTITYKYRNNEMYYFTMNGQTGKLCGKFPIDYTKLFATFIGIGAAITGLLMLGGWLIW